MKLQSRGLLVGVCMISLIVLAISAVSAQDAGQPWTDNPEHIAAMQAYVAYSGELFRAKMGGAIQYVGGLNGSVDTGSLQSDEQQFLATVSSVPSMTSADAITQAMQTMKTQIAQFRTDLKTALSAGNGSETALKAAVDNAVQADQTTIGNLDTAYWTARETSRLDEFTYNDARRTGILANLTAKGIDDTQAQAIETQIQGVEPGLKSGFDARNEARLEAANNQLVSLTQQFSKEIQSIAWQARETTRLARFDNTTTRMQNMLANLSARGLDVSGPQGILSQITAIRSQLQTAMENHDEATLMSLNSQIVSLDQQFTQSVREILAGLRQQRAQDRGTTAMNRTGFNSTNTGAARFSYGRRLTAVNGSAPQ